MNEKKRCNVCGRMLRIKNFKINKVIKEEMCNRCDKKVGSNKFYDPQKAKRKWEGKISKFKMTAQEKSLLAKRKGWKTINRHSRILESIGRKKRKSLQSEKIKEEVDKKESKKQKKKFLEGLK